MYLRIRSLAIIIGLILIFCVACGGNAEDQSVERSDAPTATPLPEPTATATATPQVVTINVPSWDAPFSPYAEIYFKDDSLLYARENEVWYIYAWSGRWWSEIDWDPETVPMPDFSVTFNGYIPIPDGYEAIYAAQQFGDVIVFTVIGEGKTEEGFHLFAWDINSDAPVQMTNYAEPEMGFITFSMDEDGTHVGALQADGGGMMWVLEYVLEPNSP